MSFEPLPLQRLPLLALCIIYVKGNTSDERAHDTNHMCNGNLASGAGDDWYIESGIMLISPLI